MDNMLDNLVLSMLKVETDPKAFEEICLWWNLSGWYFIL